MERKNSWSRVDPVDFSIHSSCGSRLRPTPSIALGVMHTSDLSHGPSASDGEQLAAWRREVASTAACVHFNHAGVAPVSRRVAEAGARFIADARDVGTLRYPAWAGRRGWG